MKAHNDAGHRSYLLGQVSNDGWWYFYFVTLAVKTPLPLLVAGPVGLVWLARNGWRERNGWALAPAVLVFAILAFASVFSRINIGIRHVLILYPFLALGAAYVTLRAWQAGAALADRRARLAGRAAAVRSGAVAVEYAVARLSGLPAVLQRDGAGAAPSAGRHRPGLGPGPEAPRDPRRALHMPKLYLAYLGTADLAREPLPPLELLKARQQVSGWVAISDLARTRRAGDYAWLDAYRPVERIGKTIDLYYIP